MRTVCRSQSTNEPHAEEPSARTASRSTRFVSALLPACLSASPASAIELSAPVTCPAGMVCPVQNLFDHDPGPGVRDFRCGGLGYDGHDGTDVRLPSLAAMRSGVEVEAASEGEVVGTRDGMADAGLEGGRAALKNVECGNGVLIRHADGYDTQYCHMAKGSVAVKQGDKVARGQTIGRVGLSGLTEFPHLHLSLRKDGRKIDPYAPEGASPTCGETKSLWAADARFAMRIEAPLTLNIGFSDGPVTNADIETGAVEARKPGPASPALVVYARVIGLAPGDGLRLTLRAPDGTEMAKTEVPPVDRPKAQWLAFVGRKRPEGGWQAGDYRATVEISRMGAALKTSEFAAPVGR
ncbi:M23 family metallopeptidase [Methylopila sp. M107]|uniref:M23 family metallopeptidase n=1 Tax=Methylopila sp. M107 TaxID=1101190 RepID=UPI0012DFBACB|nr:M23 family metallopeptidase [Methylopila sp. M107]